jgi:hypothetical protein
MMKEKNKTPEYKVNYVRVYQNPKNPKHKVGCSTPERPTSTWIKGHQDSYKREEDVSVQNTVNFIVNFMGQC